MKNQSNSTKDDREKIASSGGGHDCSTPSSYPQWHTWLSGACAGAGARMFTAPLDIIRIRRQIPISSGSSDINLYQNSSNTVGVSGVNKSHRNQGILRSMYDIHQKGGTGALFRGNVAAMNLWVGYSSIQFALYERIKTVLIQEQAAMNKNNHDNTSLFHIFYNDNNKKISQKQLRQKASNNNVAITFVSGAIAGTIATLATYPFDICRTTFAARDINHTFGSTTTINNKNRPPRSMYEFMYKVIKQKGYSGLYIGCLPSVLQIVPYMGINFAIYDLLVSKLSATTITATTIANKYIYNNTDNNTEGNNRRVDFSALAGSISGAISKTIVYPIDTVKKRLQAQAFFGPLALQTTASSFSHHHNKTTNYDGILDCFKKVYKQEGITSFYRGLVPSVLKTTIASGLSFAIYRFTKNHLQNLHNHDHTNSYEQYNISTSSEPKQPPKKERKKHHHLHQNYDQKHNN